MADNSGLLKLQARDPRDLEVISALLQDALVPVGDIDFLSDSGQFVLAANRFRWEKAEGERRGGERILCGVGFANISGVKRRGFDMLARGEIYDLLSVEIIDNDADAPGATTVQLTFAQGAAIRLTTTELSCTLEDFGDGWPTAWRPQHD
jgi:hypothetical protein